MKVNNFNTFIEGVSAIIAREIIIPVAPVAKLPKKQVEKYNRYKPGIGKVLKLKKRKESFGGTFYYLFPEEI